jgi:F-type H+-transporting ATPase subunit delta
MASALANRYARALVEVVTKPGAAVTPEAVIGQLAAFQDVFRGSVELRGVLLSPAVPPAKKKAIIAGLGARLGLGPAGQNFLYVVADHRRLTLLGEMLAAVQALLDERRGVVRAEVTTAQPAVAEDQSALTSRLAQKTGHSVQSRFQTDPGLLGGALVRIGSTIYDGSVKGRLAVLRRQIVEGS